MLVGEKSFTVPLPVPLLWAGIKPITVSTSPDVIAVQMVWPSVPKNRKLKKPDSKNRKAIKLWIWRILEPLLKKLQISTLERKSPKMTKKKKKSACFIFGEL